MILYIGTNTIPVGPKGETGDTGSQGIQGIQGIQGEQGIQGPQGEMNPTQIADLQFATPRIADFVPGTGAQLDRSFTRYNQYQQAGALQIDVVSISETGACTLQIIKTADAITVFVGATDITTIGKLDGSSDFSTTVGDVDLVTIIKLDETTDNTTGVYYSIKNLG